MKTLFERATDMEQPDIFTQDTTSNNGEYTFRARKKVSNWIVDSEDVNKEYEDYHKRYEVMYDGNKSGELLLSVSTRQDTEWSKPYLEIIIYFTPKKEYDFQIYRGTSPMSGFNTWALESIEQQLAWDARIEFPPDLIEEIMKDIKTNLEWLTK